LPKAIELKAGVYGTMPLPEWNPLSADELSSLWHPSMAQRAAVYIIGEIVYEDDIGTVRNTWFCRRRGYDEPAFTPVENPDYESAD
jgi:hypothetical protein